MSVLSVCPTGCGTLTTGGRCDPCKQEFSAERAARPIQRIYESPRWRRGVRPAVLKRDGHRCVRCGSAESLQACHVYETQAMLELGWDVFNIDLIETRCASCHGSVGALPIDGGVASAVRFAQPSARASHPRETSTTSVPG